MAIEKIRPRVVDATGNYTFNDVALTGNISAPTAIISNITGVTNLVASSTTINVTGVLSVTSNVSAGNIKTDNLLYANGTAWSLGASSTPPAGSNTQVQFNDTSSFGASANFTFNKSTNTLLVTNISANGAQLSSLTGSNITGQVANAVVAETIYANAQPNITSVGTLTSLTITGNLISGNAILGNSATSNYFIGNGTLLSSISGGNVTGQVAYAGTANSVSGSNVVGQVTFAATANAVAGANVMGSVSQATYATTANSVAGANVSGTVSSATTAGTVTTNAQPNITSVGTLTSLAVTGNITSTNANLGNLVTANFFSGNGSLLTSVGNVSGPSSSTDNAIVRFDSTTGKLIQNSLITIADDGAITAPGVGSIIPFYFADQASFPSASTYHGAVAHSHSDGKMYFAHGGSWVELGDISSSQTISNKTITSSPSVTVTGNITSNNANLGNAVTANYFIGNGSLLTGLTGTDYGNSNVAAYLPTYTGNVNANFFVGSGIYVTGVAAVTAATVTTNAQPNITSVGILTSLIIGNATANTTFGNGTITATGNISFTGANVSLGDASNLKITGGTAGYFITTDGAGNLSWGAAAGGGGVSATGSNTQIQFNDGGVLGASANLVFSKTTNTFTTGRVVASAGANLGNNVSNLYIGGGGASQILSTDGSGNLSWIAQPTAVITVDNFTGNGVQTIFTLSTTPASINQTVVNYNGAFQLRSAYSLTGPNITFSEAPANGSLIEVTSTMGATSGAGAFVTRTYTGNGVATTYTVTSGVTVSSVLVTENGLVQTPTVDYTISGSTLTFIVAPANGITIQIRELAISIATTNAPVYRAYTGNGVANTFTITSGLTANSLIVAENGIIQRPTTDYSISGSNVVFVSPPASNVDIQIRELSLNGGMSSGGISLPTQGGNSGKYLTTDGATASWANVGGSLTIKEEGSNLTTTATSIDFVGGGVTATNTGNAVTVTVVATESLSPFLLMGA